MLKKLAKFYRDYDPYGFADAFDSEEAFIEAYSDVPAEDIISELIEIASELLP